MSVECGGHVPMWQDDLALEGFTDSRSAFIIVDSQSYNVCDHS